MAVKLNGARLEGVEGLTFAELIEHARGILDHEVLVELQVNQETVSQAFLDEIKDKPIYGEIELFSLDARGLVAELVEGALQYLQQLEGAEEAHELLEGFEWLNRALALIPLGIGFPGLRTPVEQLLDGNLRLREELSESLSASAEGLRPRVEGELAAYETVFREIGKML